MLFCILEIAEYLQYVRHLDFYEDPNYNYLRNIFNNALNKNGFVYDLNFDWANKISSVRISFNNFNITRVIKPYIIDGINFDAFRIQARLYKKYKKYL